MQNFLRIAQGIQVMPVLMPIVRNADWWREDTYLRDYPQGPFGEVDSIILRFPPRSVFETQQQAEELLKNPRYDPHECVDQPIYSRIPEARALVMQVMATVGGTRLGRVIINRVKPGGRIYRHADTQEHADYWERHHLVLQSAPGARFITGAEEVWMAPGELWWFNNGKTTKDGSPRLEHEVINNSDVDRIHMVIDIRIA